MKEIEFRWWYEGVRRVIRFDRNRAREFAERLIRNWDPTIRDWGNGFFAIDTEKDEVYHWDFIEGWRKIDWAKGLFAVDKKTDEVYHWDLVKGWQQVETKK